MPLPRSVAEATAFLKTCMTGGLHFHDGEFDDVGMMKMYENADVRPAVSIVLTHGQKDRRTLALKLSMMGAWLQEPFGQLENLVLPLQPNDESQKLFLEVVRKYCVHNGRLRIVSTAPSGPYVALLLEDEYLRKIPWDMSFYSGTYNINTGAPDLKTVLMKKFKMPDDDSCFYNGNWFSAMGGKAMEPFLKDFSTLFAEEDWKVAATMDPTLHEYQERFMKVFNRELVAPDKLFQDGKHENKLETPADVIEAATKIWNTGNFDKYVSYCCQEKKWVKNKKLNILTTIARNAPNADWILGLVIQPELQHLWQLETGVLVVDPQLSIFKLVVPDDGIPANVFELNLRRPESSMMSSPSAEIQNAMISFFVSD